MRNPSYDGPMGIFTDYDFCDSEPSSEHNRVKFFVICYGPFKLEGFSGENAGVEAGFAYAEAVHSGLYREVEIQTNKVLYSDDSEGMQNEIVASWKRS